MLNEKVPRIIFHDIANNSVACWKIPSVYQRSTNCASIYICIYVLLCLTVCRCHFPPFLRILLQLFTAPGTMEVPRVRLATVQVDQVMHT